MKFKELFESDDSAEAFASEMNILLLSLMSKGSTSVTLSSLTNYLSKSGFTVTDQYVEKYLEGHPMVTVDGNVVEISEPSLENEIDDNSELDLDTENLLGPDEEPLMTPEEENEEIVSQMASAEAMQSIKDN